jgi:hypothetical protein
VTSFFLKLGLEHEGESEAAPANQLGLRNIAFAVDDIHATADRLKADGFGLVGAVA